MSNPINPATFAANLRAEMGRQNFHPEWLVEWGRKNREPTPDEIDAIVLCLGVPESRLLVSREELEEYVQDLEAVLEREGQVVRMLGEALNRAVEKIEVLKVEKSNAHKEVEFLESSGSIGPECFGGSDYGSDSCPVLD